MQYRWVHFREYPSSQGCIKFRIRPGNDFKTNWEAFQKGWKEGKKKGEKEEKRRKGHNEEKEEKEKRKKKRQKDKRTKN